MKNVAIIPARGGSKRIPRKNIKLFMGKPIIAYSIEAALQSGLFDEIMVSTDDEEIARIARQYGAKIPFMRSACTADDYATLTEVVIEVVEQYEKQGIVIQNICCILSTAPLISVDELLNGYTFLENNFDSICPVVEFSYPIFRALEITENGQLKMRWPEYLTCRSQDLEKAYHDSGTFYWIKKEILLRENTLFSEHGGAIVLQEHHVQDIDTEIDWMLAEMKYKILNIDSYGNKEM